MLDAAHGEAVSTVIVVQRVDDAGIEAQVARVGAACEVGRRRPVVTVRADIHIHASFLASAQLVQAQLCPRLIENIRQGSRRVVAVARSRRMPAIAGMNDRKNE